MLSDQASRLAWLAQIIPGLPDTGIIYTLTTRDADQVAAWLRVNDIDAKAYYSDVTDPSFANSDAYRQHLEEKLLRNELKVLVATTALGMGYDKPDLSFVIHYQAPGSIVAYYQQVGRAGRAINSAIGVLMSGAEDEDIHAYFRRSPFPTLDQIKRLLTVLSQHEGLTLRDIESYTNLRYGQTDKLLKMLSAENPPSVCKDKSKWRTTGTPFSMDQERIEHLTRQREQEWREVQNYITSRSCLMQYLCHALDDMDQSACGKCTSCLGRSIVDKQIDLSLTSRAASFLQQAAIPIIPKKQVASGAFIAYNFKGNLPACLQAQEGRTLAHWGDAGWGRMVKDDKCLNHFRDDLVDAVTDMIIRRWNPQPFPTWICYVPSLSRPELVSNFTKRLARQLGLTFIDAIEKVRRNEPQKEQQNRFYQCRNLDGIFDIKVSPPKDSVFLVDDIVDSSWTLTVVAALLLQAGSGPVYPVTLASTAVKD